ncbi:hypothetical protein [Candidatus Parabeggiatoa sp. HSG14]|uniref:hypothetical protein n=1 Tax=Candidatus Parabeggiatoa sp. HSG14 TaxID=3055593 RepID=UPI0025A8F6FB|nr:hypothetical protein [Thiotrichales bacterium HSG14]
MQYPLSEKIGDPDLFVGRKKEFRLLNKWLKNIPRRLSKSRVILARRKSGKTAIVQRIFNQVWSENGLVIPFYFSFEENKIWYPDLAIKYYCAFASQYISFLERDVKLVDKWLSLEKIRQYGVENSIENFVEEVDFLQNNKDIGGSHGLMWDIACSAPHRFASFFEKRFLVILDEFQYITQSVYPDKDYKTAPIETLPASYHSLSESKIAPMLVTGSYAGWLLNIMHEYLEAGRLKPLHFSPYLTWDEGLQAVYQYAHFYEEEITDETAVQINKLCMADPFFIYCVVYSEFEGKDLTTSEGVVNTVNYEISDDTAEMFLTWGEYLVKILDTVNNRNAKKLLLYLNKHSNRYWTPTELKNELNLNLEVDDIQKELAILWKIDVIDRGSSYIQFRGLQDGTLNLVLRRCFEEEIEGVAPNFPKEFSETLKKLQTEIRSLRGKLSYYKGIVGEHLLATAFRSRKRFALSDFFENVVDTTELNITKVSERFSLQREDGKGREIDIVAESDCGRVVLVEVRNKQVKSSLKDVEDFREKVETYKLLFPEKKALPAFLSVGDFTEDAKLFCEAQNIGMATEILHYS